MDKCCRWKHSHALMILKGTEIVDVVVFLFFSISLHGIHARGTDDRVGIDRPGMLHAALGRQVLEPMNLSLEFGTCEQDGDG